MKKMGLYIISAALITVLGAALFITVRMVTAAAQAERTWRSTPVEVLKDFGSTSRLEILPLYDEAGDQSLYQTGHGLAYLIKTDSATILMDVGNNPTEADTPPLLVNMQALDVSWEEIEALFFSHFHPDHVGGVRAWKAGEVSLGEGELDMQGKPVYAPSKFDVAGGEPILLLDPAMLSRGVATTGAIDYGETFPIALYAGG